MYGMNKKVIVSKDFLNQAAYYGQELYGNVGTDWNYLMSRMMQSALKGVHSIVFWSDRLIEARCAWTIMENKEEFINLGFKVDIKPHTYTVLEKEMSCYIVALSWGEGE